MNDFGEVVSPLAISLPMFALFALLARKFWRGQWLNLIAGNNFVTKEEMDTPVQRRLGKRISIAMIIVCVMITSFTAMSISNFMDANMVHEVALVLSFVSGSALLIYFVWLFAIQWREGKIEQHKAVVAGVASKKDVKFDMKQARVLYIILGVYILIVLIIIPLAKKDY